MLQLQISILRVFFHAAVADFYIEVVFPFIKILDGSQCINVLSVVYASLYKYVLIFAFVFYFRSV